LEAQSALRIRQTIQEQSGASALPERSERQLRQDVCSSTQEIDLRGDDVNSATNHLQAAMRPFEDCPESTEWRTVGDKAKAILERVFDAPFNTHEDSDFLIIELECFFLSVRLCLNALGNNENVDIYVDFNPGSYCFRENSECKFLELEHHLTERRKELHAKFTRVLRTLSYLASTPREFPKISSECLASDVDRSVRCLFPELTAASRMEAIALKDAIKNGVCAWEGPFSLSLRLTRKPVFPYDWESDLTKIPFEDSIQWQISLPGQKRPFDFFMFAPLETTSYLSLIGRSVDLGNPGDLGLLVWKVITPKLLDFLEFLEANREF